MSHLLSAVCVQELYMLAFRVKISVFADHDTSCLKVLNET